MSAQSPKPNDDSTSLNDSEKVLGEDESTKETAPTLLNGDSEESTLTPLPPFFMDQENVQPSVNLVVTSSEANYRLIKRLGQGACGDVYLATTEEQFNVREEVIPQTVALKFFFLYEQSQHVARIELSALRRFNSSRVPRVYDWQINSSPAFSFFVMEFFPKGAISQYRNPDKPFSELELHQLCDDLLEALKHTHGQGLLHLDIKPDNILLDNNGRFVLTDFGLAQDSNATSVMTQSIGYGTIGFRAPEQRDQLYKKLDYRSDLYSVGVVLWVFATNQRPYLPEGKEYPIKYPTCLPDVGIYNKELSPEFRDFIMKLISTNKAERPGSAAECQLFLKSLRANPEHSPVPPSIPFTFSPLSSKEYSSLLAELMDPLTIEVLSSRELDLKVIHVKEGEVIISKGDLDYTIYLLLKGKVRIKGKEDRTYMIQEREGVFMGETSAMTQTQRTATVTTASDCYFGVLNAAEFDDLITKFPMMAKRLIIDLSDRLLRESK